MRRQDELIALYPGQGSLARQLLLAQMERLATAFDADSLLRFLRAECSADDPRLRAQALCSLSRFLPAYIGSRYAVRKEAEGIWSAYRKDQEPLKRETPEAPPDPVRVRRMQAAALRAAEPLASALVEALGTASGWDRTRGVLALALLPSAAGRAWLEGELAGGRLDVPVGLALAGVESADVHARIVHAVQERHTSDPDLVCLLPACGSPAAFRTLAGAARRPDTATRMHAALSLAHFPGQDLLPVVEQLFDRSEGWVRVAALASLEAAPALDHRPWLAGVVRGDGHDLLKMWALRAAAATPGDPVAQLCEEALARGSPAVQGVALECLAQLKVGRERLAAAAGPLLASGDLKARVGAVLTRLAPEEALDAPALSELLMSPLVPARLEAAYGLGFLQSPRALGCLEALAASDPAPAVRRQAVKSLSKYPAADAAPLLMKLVAGEDTHLGMEAASVMMRYAGEEAGHAAELVSRALEKRPASIATALLLRTLGCLAGKTGHPRARRYLEEGLRHPSANVVRGALEGWSLLGTSLGQEPPSELVHLAREGPPRLRARAICASWQFGTEGMMEALAERVQCGREEELELALDSAIEVAVLLSSVGRSVRFAVLEEKLEQREAGRVERSGVEQEIPLHHARLIHLSKLIEDGFDIRRPTARGGRKSPPDPRGATAAGAADTLSKFLSELPVDPRAGSAPGLARQIGAVSNLVADGLPRPPLAARLREAARVHGPALAAAAGALALSFAVVAARAPGAPAWVEWPQPLAVAASRGGLTVGGRPWPAGETRLSPGSVIETGAGADAVLRTAAGNLVLLGPESAVEFVGTFRAGEEPQPVYRFAKVRGAAGFEFSAGERLAVDLGTSQVTSARARLVFEAGAPGRMRLEAGRALLSGEGRAPVALAEGETVRR